MNISDRLAACLKKGNLTVADLARWFARPDPTVREWVKGGTVNGPPGDLESILVRLRRMEELIKKGKLFPVPQISKRARPAYIKDIMKSEWPLPMIERERERWRRRKRC